MLERIQRWLAPPVFEDDEDKTRTARVVNALLVSIMLFLVFAGGVAVPFIFVEKLYNLVFISAFFLVMLVARWQMLRGRVRLASAIAVFTVWIVFTVFLIFAGGMTSVAAVFYVAGTVIAGLLLGTRVALIHALVCILAGLVMLILESSGRSPPRLFPVPPLVGWVDLTLGLLLTTTVLNFVLRSLNDALALARRQVEERTRAEEALRHREREFKTLVENNPDMVARFDRAYRHIYVNPAVEEELGTPPESLLGKTHRELGMVPEKADWSESLIRQVFETGQEATFELSLSTPAGVQHYLAHGVPEFAEDGTVASALFIHRNVTALKEAEEALRESEEKFSKAFQSSPLAVLITRLSDGQFIEVNTTFESFSGYRRDEVIGRTSLDLGLVNSKDRENAKHILQADGSFKNFEARFYTKSGEERIGLFSGEVIEIGGEECIIQVVSDITERKRAEEALRESEEKFSKAFHSSPLAVTITRMPDGQFVEVNQTFEILSGYSRDEVIDLTALDLELINVEDRKTGQRILQERGSFRNLEVRFYTKSGEERFGLFSGDLIEIGGEVRLIQVVSDITERKQAEEALRESHRRLEEALAELKETQEQMLHQERLAAVGQLAAGIAHDFNNILATVVLYTQMSLRTAELPSQIRKRLEIVAEQTDRAADLVQQILDFGRRAVLERHPLALDSFLKEVVKLLERTLPESIQITLDFEPVLSSAEGPDEYLINADLTRIQQAIVNLALNARDAMPKGGELRIVLSQAAGQEIQCVDCGPVIGGEWVQVTVTDTGTGIAPDVLPRIFDPFFTTRAPLGHGLGLSQVYGIVKQHGGHIDVQTQVGQGTTFKLYWPALAAARPQAGAEALPEVTQGRGEIILVVEDDATMRAVLMDVLDVLGYQVLEAANGREALTVCEQHADEIALVLSDWVMPVMGGLELVRELEARHWTPKVLMVTGHPLAEEVKEAVPENVVGWILKPPSLEQLAEAVSRALAKDHE